MSYERLYIHGAWDEKGSHAFPPADKGQEIDKGVVEKFDMIKGYSELFKVERRGSRFYYSYVRYNLISATKANRQGCNLGFTYIFDEGSKVYVLNDLLGLRQILKQATDSLLDGNRIIITSDEDVAVKSAMDCIKKYTNNAQATKFIKATNSQGGKSIALDDATNEKIFAALEKVQTVIVSPDITSEAGRFALENQRLRKELEEKGKEIDCLKQSEATLQKQAKEASKRFSNDVKSEFGDSLKLLVENFRDFFGSGFNPHDSGETTLHKKSMGDTLKELHPFFNTILLLVILIGLFVNSGKSEKEEPQITDNKTEQQTEEERHDNKRKTEEDSQTKKKSQDTSSIRVTYSLEMSKNKTKHPIINNHPPNGKVKSESAPRQDASTEESNQTSRTTPLQEQKGGNVKSESAPRQDASTEESNQTPRTTPLQEQKEGTHPN